MITYNPLWRLMEERGLTPYYLRYKCGEYNLNGSTIRRLKSGQSVSTNTIDTLCIILNCDVSDVIEHVKPDQNSSR